MKGKNLEILGKKCAISHFALGNRQKWQNSKKKFIFVLSSLNGTKKTLVGFDLKKDPKIDPYRPLLLFWAHLTPYAMTLFYMVMLKLLVRFSDDLILMTNVVIFVFH